MSKRKKSQKWILEHYECEGQMKLEDLGIYDPFVVADHQKDCQCSACRMKRCIEKFNFDVIPAADRFVDAYDPQDYYDATYFEAEDLYDYDPCAECYPRTVEGCKHCYVNGG